ncbi:GntR family transcriptional regulator [Phaeodactylibacter xiamenensis]|uniref:GntR family transcriptional regulator n=1 Tax=Phaeodactylibacter xiamenensis TaxID=1524460 RepID=UPI0024A91999|nr:GntR family transcriptional regulator [Phaeodactylibacter xiamenensis]
MMNVIEIQSNSRVPKYKQLFSHFRNRINSRTFPGNERLPSINHLSASLDVSRDTVEKAYRELKRRNLIEAVPGKGYFIKLKEKQEEYKVFLLFNKLSAHKKTIYDSFVETLGDNAQIDFHVYNNDFATFQRLLNSHAGDYTHYVIIPHFYNRYESAKSVIDQLPKDKLLLLDKRIAGIEGNYACVYQDFEQNIYDALCQSKELLGKYDNLKLIFPSKTYQPKEIIKGFQRFCIDCNFRGRLVPDIQKETLAAGEAYITLMEDDLVELVKKSKVSSLKVGRDIGIISYNENPLKEVLLDGITVISTDFQQLGRTAAEMILNERKGFVENPFRLIRRNSL